MFITEACKLVRNIEETIWKIISTGKKPRLIFTVITKKYHLNWSGIEPGCGCKQLDTEICQSKTETFFIFTARTVVMLLNGKMDLLLRSH